MTQVQFQELKRAFGPLEVWLFQLLARHGAHSAADKLLALPSGGRRAGVVRGKWAAPVYDLHHGESVCFERPPFKAGLRDRVCPRFCDRFGNLRLYMGSPSCCITQVDSISTTAPDLTQAQHFVALEAHGFSEQLGGGRSLFCGLWVESQRQAKE